MKFYTVTLLLALLVVSCKQTTATNDTDYAYFGGEIINPSNNYVVLDNNLSLKDTIDLDSNNRFLYKVSNLEPGMYSFKHGDEYQMFLLESKDSLFFRLNTNDFDESLVYTGKGSKKNNFIIKSFLDDEKESKDFLRYHQLEPEIFDKRLEVIRTEKLERLEDFLAKKPSSDLFKKIAKSNIDYNHYAYHEMYPFGYYGNKKLIHFKDLPEGFYDYRTDIDLNNENFSELYIYNRFLFWHFNNLALKKYYKNGSHHAFDKMSLNYNLEKLRLIDSSLTNQAIKNNLLKQTTRDFMLNSDNDNATLEMLTHFLEKSSNTDDKAYLRDLYQTLNSLKPGNFLPNTQLTDFNGKTLNLNSLLDAPALVYCWSSNFKMHSRNSHYVMKRLKSLYPDINFIAINFNDTELNYWKKMVKSSNYSINNEYKFKSPSEAIEKYVITFSHKIFILDKDGKIIDANADLFSEDIYAKLEKLANSDK